MILGISISRRILIDIMEREDREENIEVLTKHAYALKMAMLAKQRELVTERARYAAAELARIHAVQKEVGIRREERSIENTTKSSFHYSRHNVTDCFDQHFLRHLFQTYVLNEQKSSSSDNKYL